MDSIACLARHLFLAFLALAALTIGNGACAQVTLNLIPGWNLLGNSSAAPIGVPAAFGGNSKILTVWKWNGTTNRWAFYAPAMSSSALTTYAQGSAYEVLASIAPKEGFWVNASAAAALAGPVANGVTLVANDLLLGWNLIGTADNKTPSQLNQGLNVSLNESGKTLLSAWAWDAPTSKWRFYSPALDAQGGSVLPDYISSKAYLPFSAAVSSADGIWLDIGNYVAPTVPVSYLTGTTCPVDSNLQCSQWLPNGAACSYQSCTCYFNTPGVGADDSGFWHTKNPAGNITGIFDCKLDAGLSSLQISEGSCSLAASAKAKAFIDACNPTCANGATDYPTCTPPAITMDQATCNTSTVNVTGTVSGAVGVQLKDDSADIFLRLTCQSWSFICIRGADEPPTTTWTGIGDVNVADGRTLAYGVRAGADKISGAVTCHR